MDLGQVLSEASLQCGPQSVATSACEDNSSLLFFPTIFAHLFLKEADLEHWVVPRGSLPGALGCFSALF